MGKGAKVSPGEMPDDANPNEPNIVERGFETLGKFVGAPCTAWIVSMVTLAVMVGFSSGFAVLETENRPEKQWVAEGALALTHNDYVKETWPGNSRFNMYIAECATPGCNMLDAAHIKRLAELHAQIKAVVVDGDKIVASHDADYLASQPERPWSIWAGSWGFQVGATSGNEEKCFMMGTDCMWSSVLQAFPDHTACPSATCLATMTDAQVKTTLNAWAGQPQNAARMPGMVGAPVKDGSGDYASAEALMGSYTLTMDDVFIQAKGSSVEPVADSWEAGALCVLGVDVDDEDEWTNCEKDDLIDFKPNFMRSMGDEFGVAIQSDVGKLGIAYQLMLVYLFIMLSGWDAVNSMVGMSFVVIVIVGLSFSGCMGIGAFIGLYNNNLTNNIPFLLLGLGVDDAFVLTSEFRRACLMMPGTTVEERIGAAMRTGGMSILITSATDALAFLIGSMTVLPALSWFCAFAGIGVLLCFFLQIFLFMPFLAINARRAETNNRVDCCCCIKAAEPSAIERLTKPQGWCCCPCFSKEEGSCCTTPNKLADFMENKFGAFITSKIGIIVTLSVFAVVTIVGVIGASMIYVDFKLEWFIPEDSYVQDYFAANVKYAKTGPRFSVYTPDQDYFANQAGMQALSTYVSITPFVERSSRVSDWHNAFLTQAPAGSLTNGRYTVSATYYTDIMGYMNAAGAQHRSAVKWVSTPCDSDVPATRNGATCNTALGLRASRLSATMTLAATDKGTDRYNTMDTMRDEISACLAGAFPFSFQFMYWEEIGIIGAELLRNLLICGGVIFVMVCVMIPKFQISAFVAGTIIVSMINVVGFLYFWDVTISGVSTIYILICVGLAVDYSAHIAHMFKESTGTSKERAQKALGRIGPSVFNAVVSTLLAVVVIGFSTSYVFVVFFKAFFLVTVIGGAAGLWLLPTMLGLFGGDNIPSNVEEAASPKIEDKAPEP